MHYQRKISVIGLGYVGLMTAIAFSQLGKVIAFDKSDKRINELKNGIDKNGEVSNRELESENLYWTSNADDLKESDFYIVGI